MSDFRPSVEAAKKALGSAYLIETKDHPAGAKGVAFSLNEVAARVRKGRNDPRVRAWAVRAVKEAGAGGPGRTVAQAEAILEALHKAAVYVQDPLNTEFIQAAHETLCLDDKGLCFKGGDCDDLVVAYGSACLSIGIPVQVIGQSFKEGEPPSHVMCAIQDTGDGRWLKVDPSTNKPVGEYVFAVKEWVIDPMDPNDKTTESLSGGTFVGVGALGAVSQPTADAVTQQVQSGLYDLQQAGNGLGTALGQIAQIVKITGFDPEPTTPITDISDFPSGGAIWTASMNKIAAEYLTQIQFMISAGQDAMNGARTLYIDASNNISLGALATDTLIWSPVGAETGLIIALYNKAGTLLGGITAAVGEFLQPPQVEAQVPSAGTLQGIPSNKLGSPLLIAAFAAGAALTVVELLVVWSVMSKLANTITSVAREKSRQALITYVEHCTAAGTCTAAQAADILKTNQELMNEAAKQDAADNPFDSALDKFAEVLKWLAIGSLVVVGTMVAYPVVKELGQTAAGALKSRRLAHEEGE